MQFRQLRYTSTILLLCLLLSGCLPSQPVGQVTSPLLAPLVSPLASPQAQAVEQTAPEATTDQVAALVQGNNTFAFDLYRTVAEGSSENLIYSPYSISLAFAMAYAGAQGQTAEQMADILHFLPLASQAAADAALGQKLANLTTETAGEGGDDFRLNIANALWGQDGFPFNEAYLNTLDAQYGAAPQLLDFAGEPEMARQQINHWVAEQTMDRIKDLVPPNMISPNTKLLLANAIYFYGSWLYPFDPAATQAGDFTLLDGNQVTASLMHAPFIRVPYAEGDDYQAVQLPYWGDQVDMLILLPTLESFTAMEADLTPDLLEEVRSQLTPHDAALTLPRFEVDTSLDLKTMLMAMGLTAPFGAADFSGIGPDLFISDALHRGVITVDEEGTEAAAATALAMTTSAFPRAEMVIDHPFIFAIIERETGTILFLGRVLDPAA